MRLYYEQKPGALPRFFLQSGSCRRLPPLLTCSCLEPCVGTRPTRAPPRRHGAAWKPHGCPLNIPSGLALAPPLSVTPPYPVHTRAHPRCRFAAVPRPRVGERGRLQPPRAEAELALGAGWAPEGRRDARLARLYRGS